MIFTEGLYPGDRAVVRIERVRKNSILAAPVELTGPGPLRRAAPCPVAEECGGCDWTSLRLDAQLDAKLEILTESLVRTGGLEQSALPSVRLHPSPLRYRARGRLHWSAEGNVGFFARRSNRVVALPDECELLPAPVIESARKERGQSETKAFFFDGENVFWSDEAESKPILLEAAGWSWSATTTTFLQANRHLLGELIESVLDHAAAVTRPGLALDLYGGVGFFAVPLASVFERVISVEGDARSSGMAAINSCSGVKAEHRDVESWLLSTDVEPDYILVDPPRSGLSPSIVESLDGLRSEWITYLSCDPVTFARDVGLLTSRGWVVESLDLFDLFPNTHHIETLGLLRRK